MIINMYFSNRIYKNTLEVEDINAMSKTLLDFNNAKFFSYNRQLEADVYNKKYSDTIHMMVKSRYGFNDYFANSALQEAKGILSSQKELNKQYINDLENQIKTREKKIKDLEKEIKNKEKILNWCIDTSKRKLEGKKPLKFKSYKGSVEKNDGDIFLVNRKKYKRCDVYFDMYNFEHKYLRPMIAMYSNRTSMIKIGLNKKKQLLENRKNGFKYAIFGSKKLFKSQFTVDEYINNHNLWLGDFKKARYNKMLISGRKDAKYGNFAFKYDYVNKNLNIALSDGEVITIKNLHFPYGQDKVDSAYNNQINNIDRQPIAWEVEDHGEYYILKVSIRLPKKKHLNYSKVNGVIGYDTNFDHLAWVEVNRHGNLIDKGILKFDIEGKTTGQIKKILEGVAIELVDIAKKKSKPLVREDLKLENEKSKMSYKNKLANRKISMFAYQKVASSVISRAYKEDVVVFKVNPAFTSVIGKVKYMKNLGISVHESAALVIARRGMNFKEKFPPGLFKLLPREKAIKHHWTHWNYISRYIKGIYPDKFYKVGKTDNHSFSEMKDFSAHLLGVV